MKKLSLVSLASLLLFTATIAFAQSRPKARAKSQHQPFEFQLAAVDATTHRPRSTFFLGETVAVRISLTNLSGVARSVPQLPDTYITFKLHSTEPYEHHPEIREGSFGGTGWATTSGNMTFWGTRPPRMMTIAPGQTVSRIVTLDYLNEHPLDEGTHTLTANYNSKLRVTISFAVVVDEEKSIPLLEKLAATPVQDGRDTLQRWANAVLNLARAPSISGRILDSEGRSLNDEITIEVSGTKKIDTETRKNGRYILEMLTPGGTYTIRPRMDFYADPGEPTYTVEPASKTITVLHSEITNIDFIARRNRVEKNFALDDEGSKATASSSRDFMYEPERVIDRYRMVMVGETAPDYWNDGTRNAFPDWIEVDFGVTRKIDWINVFTLPDNLNDPPDPDLNEKFSLHGITDFDVQYWTGQAWRNVPGGAIRNNRNVWRRISFPELTTRKIRVVVLNALGGESRITEIEAIHLNDLPTAKITVTGERHTNSAMQFRLDASDRDGRIQQYELDFGDYTESYKWSRDYRKPGDKPQLTHTHTFAETGTYNVTLKVMDDSEEITATTVVVTITEPPKARRAQTSSN